MAAGAAVGQARADHGDNATEKGGKAPFGHGWAKILLSQGRHGLKLDAAVAE